MHSDLIGARLLRGGSWLIYPRYCRSAPRNHDQPDNANVNLGFRVVCLPGEVALRRAILRGGAWLNENPRNCRSALRLRRQPVYANGNIGFRVVCLPAAEIVAAAALRALEDHGKVVPVAEHYQLP